MKDLTFDQFVDFINSIEVPAQRLGIFEIRINNYHKRYHFKCLKVNQSNNIDLFGFGLNHYGWFKELPKQKFKQSKFHDEEDVSININRSEFKSGYISDYFNRVEISTKTFSMQIDW